MGSSSLPIDSSTITSIVNIASDNNLPDPFMAMLFFFVITSAYCIFSILSGMALFNPADGGFMNPMNKWMFKIIYIGIIIIGEYFVNLTLSESMCGVRQWGPILLITIVPWVLIFVVLQLFLILFPGWLAPFSNTIGYGVAKMMDLPAFLKEIIAEPDSKTTPPLAQALNNIISDKSLLINEIHTNPEEFKADWKKLQEQGILKKFPRQNNEDTTDNDKMNRLMYFVNMKDTVAEYVWNLLTGFLVTSVSYNYILNMGCDKSPEEMRKRFDDYEAKAKENALKAREQMPIPKPDVAFGSK